MAIGSFGNAVEMLQQQQHLHQLMRPNYRVTTMNSTDPQPSQ
jgi:hypothetical protein